MTVLAPPWMCPFDGEPLTWPALRELPGGTFCVIEPGTAYRHIREAHPLIWAAMCANQVRANATLAGRLADTPRHVDGRLLAPGDDVGALL